MNTGVDVSRLARSVGINRRCLMKPELLGLASGEFHSEIHEEAAARAMGILFWLRRAWTGSDDAPPSEFAAKTGAHEGSIFVVREVEGSTLVVVDCQED